jgi:Domain of unknown function (DUF5671)
VTTQGVTTPDRVGRSAQLAVRRLIVFTLLFVLVIIAAIGISGLLERLLTAPAEIAGGGIEGLARSLAFTLIGGPLAALLWWFAWTRLANESERSALGWGLYVAGMLAVSLIAFVTALLGAASSLVGGDWEASGFSTAVTWATVWLWHRWMWRHPDKGPVRLATVPAVVGSAYGLVVAVLGAVNSLRVLFEEAIQGSAGSASVGASWTLSLVQALVWTIGGGLVWWWHWRYEGARRTETKFAAVALVVVGVLGAGILALVGAGTMVFVLLRLAFARTDPMAEILDPLAQALAFAAIGSLVWAYHWRYAMARSLGTRQASVLVISGVGLGAAATGIGIIVNSLLADLGDPLVGTDSRLLLLGGISALAIGGPVWWLFWKPRQLAAPDELKYTGRRVYLVTVFGLSALVALITLLVVGYGLFEFLLEPATTESLIDRIRVPLGLLVAAALVAIYHFSVWRRDQALAGPATPAPERAIGQIILVANGDAESQARAIQDATGAPVTVWRRATTDEDAVHELQPATIASALAGVGAPRVLVVAGPGDRIEIVPLVG